MSDARIHTWTVGYVTTIWGDVEMPLNTPEEIEEFRAGPEAFYARRDGVTVEQYRAWIETDGRPRCAGHTRKGNRCPNPISGPARDLAVHARLDRSEYCAIHGGPESTMDRQ